MRREWNSDGATASNVAALSRQSLQDNAIKVGGGGFLPQREWFPVMALQLWGHKVAAHLQVFFAEGGDATEVSDRTRRSWANGEGEPPARVLALLLRSSDGHRVLAWIMDDCEPAWWSRYLRAERIYNALAAELRE